MIAPGLCAHANGSRMSFEQWDDVRLLLSVHRSGSLKKAARSLGVHVSTVSRRLDVLERTLEVHLFDRTHDGIVSTSAAERLLPFAEAIEQRVLEMGNALDGFEAEPEGTVRVTAPPSFVEHFLVDFAGQLIDRYPKIRLELLASVKMADLTRREADIAVRTHRPTTGDLLTVALMTDVGSGLFADRPLTFGRRQLNEARFLTYAADLEFLPECQWVLDNVEPERVVLRTSTLSTQVEAARRGLGVVVLARPYEHLEGLHRVHLKPDLARQLPPFPTSSLFLVAHRALRHVPRVAVTWEMLKRQYQYPRSPTSARPRE